MKPKRTTSKPTGLSIFNHPNLLHIMRGFLWVWLTLILALYLSWMVLTKADFLYGIWHDHAGIGEHIERYAPQNRFRHGFEHTDADARKTLFAGIVDAIHQQGSGLTELNYTLPDRPQNHIPLLHRAEIVHLTDVALLIEFMKKIGWALLLIWAALTTYLLMTRQAFPSAKNAMVNLVAGLGLLLATLFIYGPKDAFYQLHIWVFPADHPWFFYYQDSLMSTMMKAPDLFAYIAASLLALGLLFFALLFSLFSRTQTPKEVE